MLSGNRTTVNLNEPDPTMEGPRNNTEANGTSGNVNQAASTTPPGIEKLRIDNVPHHL